MSSDWIVISSIFKKILEVHMKYSIIEKKFSKNKRKRKLNQMIKSIMKDLL